MIKSLIKGLEAKAGNAQNDLGTTRGVAKAVGFGAIETTIDLLTIVGAIAVPCVIISCFKKKEK